MSEVLRKKMTARVLAGNDLAFESAWSFGADKGARQAWAFHRRVEAEVGVSFKAAEGNLVAAIGRDDLGGVIDSAVSMMAYGVNPATHMFGSGAIGAVDEEYVLIALAFLGGSEKVFLWAFKHMVDGMAPEQTAELVDRALLALEQFAEGAKLAMMKDALRSTLGSVDLNQHREAFERCSRKLGPRGTEIFTHLLGRHRSIVDKREVASAATGNGDGAQSTAPAIRSKRL